MKDTKTFLLLFVSILLLAVSVTLLWSWGSQFRQLSRIVDKEKPALSQPVPAQMKSKTDTLKEVYQTALLQLDKSIDSVWNSASSVKEDLAIKLASFYKLRTEITALFNEEQTAENIHLARIKIMELQDKVRELNITNTDIERENRRLLGLIRSMNTQGAVTTVSNNDQVSPARTTRMTTETPEIIASDIYFAAIKETDNRETQSASLNEASGFIGSFQVRTKGPQESQEEVIVVVLQPDGRVLQKSTWESGSFDTNSGKKIYSCKLQLQPSNGETKKLSFTINSENPQKGSYTIQLYHKGKLIGNARKSMS